MVSSIQDTALGAAIRLVTKNKLLKYPEEQDNFKLPTQWLRLLDGNVAREQDSDGSLTREKTAEARSGSVGSESSTASDDEEAQATAGSSSAAMQRVQSIPIVPMTTRSGDILVDWYTTDDPENPLNWSRTRKALVTSILCIYTFVVYMSSAIYTTSEHGIMEEFGVNAVEAGLGLALFVLGYGVGPSILSPLSELPSVGRNPPYIASMFIFVIISIPTALVTNYPGLMVLRFLQGFFGSPCLASGGASIMDMYGVGLNLPYPMMVWTISAFCGPALGPLLSGFSVPVLGWRWSLLEILFASAPVFLIMFAFLPETSSDNILLRRARRLRALTQSDRFQSKAEIEQKEMTFTATLADALIKPMEISIKDPAVAFVQIYTAIIYGIYYSFFEVFPLVFPVYYGMSAGQIGLVFLCMLVAGGLGMAMYSSYLAFYMHPRIRARGDPVHETRLVPALAAAFGPTIGLFIFAWTARPDIHWIAPTVGITLYGASGFVVMQCLFCYIPLSYPRYAASLFAANDLCRSALAFASVLFARPLFANLGVARGVTLLAGLSVLGIVGMWALWRFGARLRAMSKFAVSESDEIVAAEQEKQ
ncbi:hypothetical protein MCOR25_000718 [Pyricularia grisea]|uniref:Major facilitator superfamily (MFS) profile domain-containing protein n=1 Tax=Pyricularia grisea TaxID=148305 RepID=A0A6P8B9B2_PYRGI|nr:uncharacterized protein PgNI_03992 [Pyricularia grisea]KAI6382422.1 hypothetical protein MCOR25_000718 [Pyricularia grisea]TLD12414.1 hypothetical protein PgNI_03992 [Pyricularia grisea]